MTDLETIESAAVAVGLDLLGVTTPKGEPTTQARYDAWISEGRHGEMRYLERHAAAKTDAGALLPGCRSVFVFGLGYNRCRPTGSHPLALREARREISDGRGRVAMYAWGRDYHKVLRRKLRRVVSVLHARYSEHEFQWGADATPLLETDYARRAGLGFQGKHTLVINRRLGSWFVLGEVMSTMHVQPGVDPVAAGAQPRCGTACHHCRDICPTGALDDEWRINARRCISYLTIEHRGRIPEPLRPLIGDWLFGCDLCQQACPWNVRAAITGEEDFLMDRAGPDLDLGELLGLRDDAQFTARFRGTALMRAGRQGMVRNACVVAANTKATHLIDQLRVLSDDTDDVVAEHAKWACDVITGGSAPLGRPLPT